MATHTSRQLNLIDGPILKTLARLAAPIMATAFLSTAYNLTDAFWVGQLGADAVAGVGTGGMYLWLSGGLTVLARTGGQVYTAQAIGAGDRHLARGYSLASIRLALLLGLLYGALCALLPAQLLSFFRLNDALTFRYAKEYLRITGGCIVFSFLTQVMTGLFTARGDSKTPFICNVAGLVVNMILDPLLILGFGPFPRLEAVGAAVATVTAQLLVLVLMLLHRRQILRDGTNEAARSGTPYTRNILRLSLPHAVQATLYCGFSMILARMIASFGDDAVAVQRIGGQIEAISWNVSDGFAASLNAFTAQNLGAGKKDRYRRGYYYSSALLFAWGLLIALLFFFGAGQIAGLFFHESGACAIMVSYLTIISICEPFMCIEILTVGALSALEKTRLSSIISITLTGTRIPLALFLTGSGFGIPSFWWALTLSSVAKGIVFFTAYTLLTRTKKADRP
ncbi:MAG: MATE family efflux transporter [Lachnospiraceae bacterium]|nr:MATE family efflux transporter [Lachnospiraceae bacterium]